MSVLKPPEKVVIRLSALPPSVNSMYANIQGRGRVKSAHYKAWANVAGWDLKNQRASIRRFTTPVYVTIAVAEPKRRCDLDNRIKATLDLLVEHQIIPDDSNDWVRGVNIYFAPEPDFEGVEIAISEAPASCRRKKAA